MQSYLIIGIITLILFTSIVIYKLCSIYWKNYYNNLYDKCRREFPIKKERQPYLLKYRLSKYEHTKEFKTQKELISFCNEYKSCIFDVESYEINSYNYIQIE